MVASGHGLVSGLFVLEAPDKRSHGAGLPSSISQH